MTGLLSKHDFRVALQEAIAGRASAKAAFSQAWMDGTLQRHHFARWAENHYHYVGPFADYLGYIYNNARDEQDGVKDLLLQSMYEFRHLQEGGGHGLPTRTCWIRFAQACGTTRERVESPQACNPITRGMQAWCCATAIRESPVVATAALLVGLASQIPQITPGRSFRALTRASTGSASMKGRLFRLEDHVGWRARRAGTGSCSTGRRRLRCSNAACSSCDGARRCATPTRRRSTTSMSRPTSAPVAWIDARAQARRRPGGRNALD